MNTLIQDLRYGLRVLAKAPGFTLVSVLTLALGIGANTAIFSIIYAVLLKPLPFANPEQLVNVFDARPQEGVAKTGLSYLNFSECRKQNEVFSEMAGSQAHDLTLTGAGDPSIVHTVVVTPEIFSLLEAKPIVGRTFMSEDGKGGAAPVVILTENLWRSRFGGDPNLIGRSINLDKRPFTVIGIMPAGFRYPLLAANEDVWIPLVQDPLFGPWMSRPGGHWLGVVGRLKPGVSIAKAQASMDTISARLAKESPAENSGWAIRVESSQHEIAGNVKPALLVILGAVGLVLLIACVNVANLLLSRATSRAREIAVRIALGAGRMRIVRQLLTESGVLGLLGGVAGLLLAYWGVEGLGLILPPGIPRAETIRIEGWVLVFALVLSLMTSLLFGLAPAFFAAGSGLQASLKENTGRSSEGSGRQRTRRLMVVGEIALSMVLLISAGLLIRSFNALMAVNPGFNVQHVVRAEISLPTSQYATSEQWTAFSNESLARIQAQPGMRDSALAVPLPIIDGFVNLAFNIENSAPLPLGSSRTADYAAVSPEYFHVMEIPLLRGRFFDKQDSLSASRVAIISQALARQYFPNQDPLGRRLLFGFPPNGNMAREIVGIVGDVRDVALSKDPGPMMYVPFAQAPFWGEIVVTRSSLSTSVIAAAVRQSIRGIDKDLPVTDIESLPEAVHADASVAQIRFRTLVLTLFGAMALALATVGVFGVVSYSVSRRTHEIGIRIALGASSKSVLQLVLGESAKMIIMGLAIGIPVASALTRFLSSLLFGIRPSDLFTFAAVSVLLTVVTLVACYFPARRASHVDPLVALRYE